MIRKHIKRIVSNIPAVRHLLAIRQELKQLDGIAQSLRRITQSLEPHLRYDLMLRQEAYLADLMRSPRYSQKSRLLWAEQQVFSQHGEDGILREIFHRIGETDRSFVEIGVGNGLENNTTYLLLKGWSGLWVDGNAKDLAYARREFRQVIEAGRLRIIESFVSRLNIVSTLNEANIPAEFDLLSLDIDRNTWFVWEALGHLRPRVVVVEYNPAFPPGDEWCVDDQPEASWNASIYFGASLKSWEILGNKLGYHLVGCDTTGTNAFFVRADLTQDRFCEPFAAENHYEPPRYFLNRYHSFPHRRKFSDTDPLQ